MVARARGPLRGTKQGGADLPLPGGLGRNEFKPFLLWHPLETGQSGRSAPFLSAHIVPLVAHTQEPRKLVRALGDSIVPEKLSRGRRAIVAVGNGVES